MLVDFHTHTTYSDGMLSPEALLQAAKAAGITRLAITDHDTVDGYRVVKDKPSSLTLYGGIELSSAYEGREVHVLGYHFDIDYKPLVEYTQWFKEERLTRAFKMIDQCKSQGYDISREDLHARFPTIGALGRPHIAQLLVDKGYVGSISEAFHTLLHPEGPCYVPKYRSTVKAMVDLIHDAGGLAVLAHPKLVKNEDYVLDLLELPFDGVEVYHSKHSESDSARYLALAKERNLLVSGGSDFHAIPGRFPEHIGGYPVEDSQVQSFIEAITEV